VGDLSGKTWEQAAIQLVASTWWRKRGDGGGTPPLRAHYRPDTSLLLCSATQVLDIPLAMPALYKASKNPQHTFTLKMETAMLEKPHVKRAHLHELKLYKPRESSHLLNISLDSE
jgi:hypothetical protein